MPAPGASVLSGLFAAIPTPILDDGRLDLSTLDRLVAFVVRAGVHGVCIGGATGEYPHFEIADRQAVIQHVGRILPNDRTLLVGIGGPSIRHVLGLGRAAINARSRALLLPMPMFFRYEQEDLRAYCA